MRTDTKERWKKKGGEAGGGRRCKRPLCGLIAKNRRPSPANKYGIYPPLFVTGPLPFSGAMLPSFSNNNNIVEFIRVGVGGGVPRMQKYLYLYNKLNKKSIYIPI